MISDGDVGQHRRPRYPGKPGNGSRSGSNPSQLVHDA